MNSSCYMMRMGTRCWQPRIEGINISRLVYHGCSTVMSKRLVRWLCCGSSSTGKGSPLNCSRNFGWKDGRSSRGSRSDQYESEHSFEQVGAWQPWRYNPSGQVICEVAAARFTLKRPDDADPAVTVEVALIRDWRKLVPVEGVGEAADESEWQADLPEYQRSFWEEGWQAVAALPAPTTPKLLPVITTGHGMEAVELAQTYFSRWNCQENAIRDWLIPQSLGYQSWLRQRAGGQLRTGETPTCGAREAATFRTLSAGLPRAPERPAGARSGTARASPEL